MNQYAFAVDWDGVCVENAWPEMGEWIPGAIDGLRRLDKLGTIVIHTARVAPFDLHPHGSRELAWRDETVTAEAIREVKEKLDEIGLGHIEVWTRPYKPPALIYIDDRGYRFEGDWNEVVNYVEELVSLAPPQVARAGTR